MRTSRLFAMLAASLMALPSCGKVEPDTGGKEDPTPKTDTYAVLKRSEDKGKTNR